MFGVYVHIPFCVRKCGYCDFYSMAVGGGPLPVKSYLTALKRQLVNDVENMGLRSKPIETVYFGGGTPSLMPTSFFAEVMGLVAGRFALADDVEVSCEVNPATVGGDWFTGVAAAGCNRCSIGVQSFSPKFLKMLGRAHTTEDAMRAIAEAQDAGFKGVSFDLMYGIPTETMAEMEDDARLAMTFQPEHISAYQLTVEKGTPFAQKYDPDAFDESLFLKQMRAVTRMLQRGGWARYEISNYAKKGCECRHNLNYWNYGEYLGLGAGAVSFIKNQKQEARCKMQDDTFAVRYAQAKDVGKYIDGKGSVEEDVLDAQKAMAEFCFLGLRKTEGFAIADFEREFGREFRAVYGKVGDELVKGRLLEDAGGRLVLTPRGMELSNQVFEKFIA